ncbi:hypothetical protein RF11_09840 [Thelohanellus kitauei]|uniref:Uncharacterized protein n=1 Tax=Thelohanellus kitauei TaxID=669202 RepID=A0A0C2NJA4_THEKT|nr:hypothetical protein RF11_09840 [Thelohanellus kitauei]
MARRSTLQERPHCKKMLERFQERKAIMRRLRTTSTSSLVYTGSARSFIRTSLVNINASFEQSFYISLLSANGSNLELTKTIELKVYVNGRWIASEFIDVSKLIYPAIIGRDFLGKYKLCVDVSKRQITHTAERRNMTNKAVTSIETERKLDWGKEQEGSWAFIIEEFYDLFTDGDFDLGTAVGITHCIHTGTNRPVCQKMYHVSIGLMDEETTLLNIMLEAIII